MLVNKKKPVNHQNKVIPYFQFMNTGQVCIAPDYVIVHKSKKEEFIASVKKYITEFYGEDPSKTPDYARIVNDRNFERVKSILEGAGGKVIFGGESNAEDRYIAPTILDDVTFESNVMDEEVWLGPFITDKYNTMHKN